MTKQQLLDTLATYDKTTLEKLVNYADLLLIPESDLLINVTMSQMISKAHSLADQYFSAWTDRSESDFGQFIVELLALFSEKDFWYINAFASEAFLQTMTVYSNAYVRSLELGYSPQNFSNAAGKMKFTFPASATDTVLNPGDLVVTLKGLKYTNYETVTIAKSGSTSDVIINMVNGTFETKTFNFNGKSVLIVKTNVDTGYTSVYVNDVLWSSVRTLADSQSGDKIYMLLPEENASLQVVFGKDGFGVTPNVGDLIKVTYLYGDGSLGDILLANTDTVAINSGPASRYPALAVQVTDFSGGVDQESMQSIKNNAPVYTRTQGMARNTLDVKNILESLSTVARAVAFNYANIVNIYAIPADGSVATQSFMDSLALYIGPLLTMGYSSYGQLTNYKTVGPLSLTIYKLSGYDGTDISAEASQLLQDYTDPLVDADYGQSFILSTVVQHIISNVAGVQNVVFTSVAGGSPTDVVVGKGEIMQKVTSGNIHITVLDAV